jgi:peptidoglycan/LPS O-acetylase OafA/YrhL
LLAWQPLVFFGEASYAIYILHVPIARWFGVMVHHLFNNLADDPRGFNVPDYPSMLGYFLVLLIVSAIVHQWMEAPIRNRLRRGLGKLLCVKPRSWGISSVALTPP